MRVLTMNRDFDPRKFPMAAFDAADDDGDEVVDDLDTFQLMLATRAGLSSPTARWPRS